jgi:hypothetical protein
MSENMTNTVGFKNPHTHPVYFEINELNIKVELPPGKFIIDTQGNLLNDPVFDAYCHQNGLCKVTSDAPVPLRLVPAAAKAGNRPNSAVTQAQAFVRNPTTGTVQPVYNQQQITEPPPVNKIPILGMSVENARQLGLIGKPRLVPEDYGADESTGAPERGKRLPDIKISIESQPRVRTAAPLRPEQMESSLQDLPPAEIARRAALQNTITQAHAVSPEQFDPARIRPLPAQAPVALRATDEPIGIIGASQIVPAQIQPIAETAPAPAPRRAAPVAPRPVSAKRASPKRARTVVIEDPPSAPAPAQVIQQIEEQTEKVQSEAPADEAQEQATEVETTPAEQEGRYVCAADGKPFKFRSELKRHIDRNFPQMAEQLMAPYPPE